MVELRKAGVFSIMVLGAVFLSLTPSFANVKAGKYTLDSCIPEEGEYLSEESRKHTTFNVCSKEAQALYDKVLKNSKANFNNKYVLVEIRYLAKDHNTGKPTNFNLFNYVAIDPKTKRGFTLPYTVYNENGSANPPSLRFNLSSDKVCTTRADITFSNEGSHTSNTSYENDPICVRLATKGKKTAWEDVWR